MPAKKSFGAAALFWSFALGVTLALVVCAGVFKVINDAPVPFVTKVQTVQNEGDELRALKDPNQPLYKEGQGTEQKSADAVATITAAGTSDGPTMAPADQAAADGKIDTMRYWVQAGAFRPASPSSVLTPPSTTAAKAANAFTACGWGLLTLRLRPKKSSRVSRTMRFRAR